MSAISTYKCDMCGVTKGDGSHWFKAVFFSSSVAIYDWDFSSSREPMHLCGDVCVQRAVQQWLNERKAETQEMGT